MPAQLTGCSNAVQLRAAIPTATRSPGLTPDLSGSCPPPRARNLPVCASHWRSGSRPRAPSRRRRPAGPAWRAISRTAPPWIGSDMCPTPRTQHVAGRPGPGGRPGRPPWARSSGRGRSRPRGSGSGSRAPARGSSSIRSLPGRSWRPSRRGTRYAGRVPLVRRAERHQGVHPLVAAEPLHVVAGDQAAHAVPDHVDALEPGLASQMPSTRVASCVAATRTSRSAGCS